MPQRAAPPALLPGVLLLHHFCMDAGFGAADGYDAVVGWDADTPLVAV
eukprot:gene49740-30502_t